MKFSPLPLVLCSVAVLLGPAGASGQTTTEQPGQAAQSPGTPGSTDQVPPEVRRPYRGLFGGPADPTKSSLDLRFSAFGGYDDDLLGGYTGGSTLPSAAQQSGMFGSTTAGLTYTKPGDRFAMGADADASVSQYPSLNETNGMYRADGNLSARLTRTTRLNAGGDLTYAPEYRLGLFVDPTSLTGSANPFQTVSTDYDLFRMNAFRSGGHFLLTQALGRRARLETFYNIANVDYANNNQLNYRDQVAGIRFVNRFSQRLALRAGYSYDTATYGLFPGTRRVHNVDLGVDYDRPLSRSRRTSISFSTGSAILTGQTEFSPTFDNKNVYWFTANAALRHEIGRTWTAIGGYRRSVDWREGFVQPFLSDGFTGSLEGLVSRRLRFTSSADYAFGTVGLSTVQGDNRYDSVSGQAGLEYSVSRTVAVFTRYVYYHYHFDSGVVLDPRLVPALDRQGARVGVTIFLPVVR
jgi:hypothetical protein